MVQLSRLWVVPYGRLCLVQVGWRSWIIIGRTVTPSGDGWALLEVQAARKGYDAPPDIVMEIEDLRTEIATLEQGEGEDIWA